MNKRGLSGIVTAVLLMLLAIVAVSLIWLFVVPIIGNTGTNVDKQTFCLSNKVDIMGCNLVNVNGFAGYAISYLASMDNQKALSVGKTTLDLIYSDGSSAQAYGLGELKNGQASSVTILADKILKQVRINAEVKVDGGKPVTCESNILDCATPESAVQANPVQVVSGTASPMIVTNTKAVAVSYDRAISPEQNFLQNKDAKTEDGLLFKFGFDSPLVIGKEFYDETGKVSAIAGSKSASDLFSTRDSVSGLAARYNLFSNDANTNTGWISIDLKNILPISSYSIGLWIKYYSFRGDQNGYWGTVYETNGFDCDLVNRTGLYFSNEGNRIWVYNSKGALYNSAGAFIGKEAQRSGSYFANGPSVPTWPLDGKWHYFVTTYNYTSGKAKYYLDEGKLSWYECYPEGSSQSCKTVDENQYATFTTLANTGYADLNKMTLGSYYGCNYGGGYSGMQNASYDEFALYNRVLSQDEIESNYNLYKQILA